MARGSTMARVAVAAAAFSAAAAPGSAFLAPTALPPSHAPAPSSPYRFTASHGGGGGGHRRSASASAAALRMVAQPPVKPQKLDKINVLKRDSEALREPVRSQMQTEEISISHDAYQILKFHGSYMQDDRSLRKKGQEKVGREGAARGPAEGGGGGVGVSRASWCLGDRCVLYSSTMVVTPCWTIVT